MNTPLYEKIYKYIISEIKQGKLTQGDRVPSEKDLAEQFNVSRITSKKALDLLAQNKIIERIRGKGSFVAAQQQKNEEVDDSLPLSRAEDSKLIALIIPDFDNAFGLNLVKAIERTCQQNNINLIIRRTGGRSEEEEKAIRDLVKFGVDGLIIFPVHGEHYNTELLKLVLSEFPLVLVDRYLKGIPASSVCTNNQEASEALTNYLFSLGHKDIAFLSPSPIGTSTIEERLQGFHFAYSKQGLKLNPNFLLLDLISSLPQNIEDALASTKLQADYEAIKQFIVQNPSVTAFIVCEYYLALALKNVLSQLGKSIPRDYSIVCFDCPENLYEKDTFTHIRQHEEEMGKMAVHLLKKQLRGEKIPKHTTINFSLIKGKTTSSISSISNNTIL
ncbi:GntR family transcriptional regulator [Metabacillus niabensis]|uniref:DNA-binding LacI/PurR family transcriptional regulator n=1 Tax=Metabacillus niabensis TaxID=324854 RepID=A0ABT9Z406_9BACI|nr:GntR family transcriptional regulator [Metabacillus niabensis]MDQ0226293.1 DNA-binding LacI/PurR family transcriptional regulator [Metabacillus niabensis]